MAVELDADSPEYRAATDAFEASTLNATNECRRLTAPIERRRRLADRAALSRYRKDPSFGDAGYRAALDENRRQCLRDTKPAIDAFRDSVRPALIRWNAAVFGAEGEE